MNLMLTAKLRRRRASRSYLGTDPERRFKDQSSEVHGHEMIMLYPALEAEETRRKLSQHPTPPALPPPEPVWGNPMGDGWGRPS